MEMLLSLLSSMIFDIVLLQISATLAIEEKTVHNKHVYAKNEYLFLQDLPIHFLSFFFQIFDAFN
jgi:hypothetical protein